MSQPLSERAKRRLKIAAGLLRGGGRRKRDLGLSRERFYEDIQALISGLTPEERSTLKELTDWVEAYDIAADAAEDLPEKRGRSTHPKRGSA